MERQTIDLTAKATGFTAGVGDAMYFTFNYTDARGWTHSEQDWSWDYEEDHSFDPPDLPPGPAGKPQLKDQHYTCHISVSAEDNHGHSALSPEYHLEIYRLKILALVDRSFRTGPAYTRANVEVGTAFAKDASAANTCTSWDWDMEEPPRYFVWVL